MNSMATILRYLIYRETKKYSRGIRFIYNLTDSPRMIPWI